MSKVGKIAKDWASTRFAKMPVDQEWYQKRIEACSSCEYNSENVAQKDKSEAHIIREGLGGIECQGKWHCTACGCCGNQKASMKTSVCGLIELGKNPKWSAIEIENDEKDYSILNLTPQNCRLKSKGKAGEERYVFAFGKTSAPVLNLEFEIYSEEKCQYVTMERECNCFHLETSQKNDRIVVKAQISTKDYKEGLVTEKKFDYIFRQKSGETRARFAIEIIKTGPDEL